MALALGLATFTFGSVDAMAQDSSTSATETTTDKPQKGDKKGGPRGEMTPAKQVERLNKQLSLTDEQQEALTTFYTEQQSAREANKPTEGTKPDEDTMKANMEAEREAEKAKLKEILTDDQYTKYEEMMSKGPQKGDKGGKGDKSSKKSSKSSE